MFIKFLEKLNTEIGFILYYKALILWFSINFNQLWIKLLWNKCKKYIRVLRLLMGVKKFLSFLFFLILI